MWVGWKRRSNTNWYDDDNDDSVWTEGLMGTCPSYVKRVIWREKVAAVDREEDSETEILTWRLGSVVLTHWAYSKLPLEYLIWW